MSPYTKKQIIKHALQYYIQRPGAYERDSRELSEIETEEQDFLRNPDLCFYCRRI